ncbi:Putative Actinobacterial Holin-X, holin superfamily III (plasmid) [Caballeronia sp. SBC1]|uniref:phage holin family protein n=1 Tax=unclassified Caballeronia TaxID=2646786 RepID=UPI0013E13887|nr:MULTISPECIES: phage holin family protein [unclassified Caballeronia]QIE30144.1 Putative Actinobacterial Holin-X, holin superfamily III [Caballeronia sp. SBC2]QIN67500.1 Putative Actinobacterial Holin-X, holin superfamily III [Caballeronia sp. SBC1]
MSAQSKIMRWRNVGRFCAQRVADYGELFRIELADTKTRMLHEVIALVALAVGALFTLSFLCIAIIVSAWGTPYFLIVVWGVAATWLVVTIGAFLVLRAQRPGQSFQTLQRELQRDVESIKEALK